MFSAPPIGPQAIKSINPAMEAEGYYKAYLMPGVSDDKRYSTCYGFNCVINVHASKEKQDVLHHMYRFIMSDLLDCWKATAPLTLARKSGWTDYPEVKSTPEHPGHPARQGHRRLPAAYAGVERARRRHAPRGSEGHAGERRHQGGAERSRGRGRPCHCRAEEGLAAHGRPARLTLDRPRAGARLALSRAPAALRRVAFVLPALLFFVFFKYGPMGWAFWLSFTSYDMLSPPRFVGLANFAGLAGDPVFLQSLQNTLVYIVALDDARHAGRPAAGAGREHAGARRPRLHERDLPDQRHAHHRRLPGVALPAPPPRPRQPAAGAVRRRPDRLAHQRRHRDAGDRPGDGLALRALLHGGVRRRRWPPSPRSTTRPRPSTARAGCTASGTSRCRCCCRSSSS